MKNKNELGPVAKLQAYQRLFDLLCDLKAPPVRSEMDEIITHILKNWGHP